MPPVAKKVQYSKMEVTVDVTTLTFRENNGLDCAVIKEFSGNVTMDLVINPENYKLEVVQLGRLGFKVVLIPLPRVRSQDA